MLPFLAIKLRRFYVGKTTLLVFFPCYSCYVVQPLTLMCVVCVQRVHDRKYGVNNIQHNGIYHNDNQLNCKNIFNMTTYEQC